jgi:plastocyanin
MGRLLATALLVAAAGITLVAVNGPGKDKPEAADANAPSQSSATVVPAEPDTSADKAGAIVEMKGLRFRPGSVTVQRGQVVRFVNHDNVTHTVFQDLGARSGLSTQLDSKRIPPGGSYDFVPRADGQIAFICTLHPTVMIGQILVEEPAA